MDAKPAQIFLQQKAAVTSVLLYFPSTQANAVSKICHSPLDNIGCDAIYNRNTSVLRVSRFCAETVPNLETSQRPRKTAQNLITKVLGIRVSVTPFTPSSNIANAFSTVLNKYCPSDVQHHLASVPLKQLKPQRLFQRFNLLTSPPLAFT